MSQLVVAADPVVCHCFKIRQSAVEDLVLLNGVTTVQEVKKTCGAGGGCMGCRRRIQCLIDKQRQMCGTESIEG